MRTPDRVGGESTRVEYDVGALVVRVGVRTVRWEVLRAWGGEGRGSPPCRTGTGTVGVRTGVGVSLVDVPDGGR